MADQTVVHIGENSPQRVAHVMAREILFQIEGKEWNGIDRKTFLDTYAECLQAVNGFRKFS